MHHIKILVILFLLLSSTIVYAQDRQTNNIVLAQGKPLLTKEMVIKFATIYEIILEIKFTSQQQERLQQGIINYWIINNTEAIKQCLSNLKYYGQSNELESLRNTSQALIVESLRRDILATHDEVSIVLVEAFDKAHPDLSQQTAAKTFDDLIGNWKQTDYLLQQKNSWDDNAAGVGYTNTETFEINSDHTFKLIKIHDHYSNGCDQRTASTETGRITVKGIDLVLKVEKGTLETSDNCNSQFNKRTVINLHTETYVWSVRPNPDNEKAIMLCLNTEKDPAVCYEKQ
jgi:hypothetical protein